MKTKLNKYKLKHDFPFIELGFISSFLFLLFLGAYRYVDTKETEWLLLTIGILFGLFFFYWLANSRNKTVTFDDEIAIRPWFSFRPTVLQSKEIQGYRLKETYTRWGLDDHIQILTKSGRKFEFIKDAYSDYGQLKTFLENYGIKYLGKKQIDWKYKLVYSKAGIYASVIAAVLFAFVQLMKLLK